MSRVLILAYGNPMRCDDGLAWHAADALEGKLSAANGAADVEIVRRHQLSPELADTIRQCEAVIFVDAISSEAAGNSSPGEVRLAKVMRLKSNPTFSHQLSPATLLELAHQLFGAHPRAFSVTLAGQCFDHGESLSPVVLAALPALVARIEGLVQEFLSSEFPSDHNKS